MYQGLISVVVTTYNWPEVLKLVLMSLNNQTDQNFEVLIADDGSKEDTGAMIEKFKRQASYPITHLWQEDKGFRAARARNMGIQAAKGNYIVFLDGDCIPRHDFIVNHRYLAQKQYFVVGHRIILDHSFTQRVLTKNLAIWQKGHLYWLTHYLKKHSNKILPLLTIKIQKHRYKKPMKWQGAKTCNLAFWRDDLIKTKGFDEGFEGWGYEDSDLVIRILNTGVKRKSGKYATEVFHLWHKEADRSSEQENLERLNNLIKSHKIFPEKSLLNCKSLHFNKPCFLKI